MVLRVVSWAETMRVETRVHPRDSIYEEFCIATCATWALSCVGMILVASVSRCPVVAHPSVETLIHPHIQGDRTTAGRSPTLLSKAHRG
jgi:hypothetical protein